MSYFGLKTLFLLFCISSVRCWFEYCDHTINLESGKSIFIVSPYYPKYYPLGSSCRYTIRTSTNYLLEFNCTIDLFRYHNTCTTEHFYFNSEGPKAIDDSEYFCGNGTFTRQSIFNQASIFYTSASPSPSSNTGDLSGSNNNGGQFKCLIKSISQLCDCGWSMSGKIVGGQEAFINEFPSMGGVVLLSDIKKIFCGATIIHHRYLVSAAHCFMKTITNDPKKIGILVGEHDTENRTETVYTDLYHVEKIILHEDFDPKNLKHDIALIRTQNSIQWNFGVIPACLPYKFNKNYFIGKQLDVAGWGTTSFGGNQSKKLLKTTLDVINRNDCQKSVKTLDENQFCTYTDNKDTCQYDSGGALYYRGYRNYAIGIASYGFACALKIPSINTDILSYLPWIEYNSADANYCKI